SLTVQDGSCIVITQLMGDSDSLLSGNISLAGGSASSIYTGTYSDANISVSSGIAFLQAGSGLTVSGSGGLIALTGASKGSITAIATTGTSVNLGDIAKGESLTLENASSMIGGSLSFNVDADALMGGSTAAIIKGSLSLTGTSILIGESASSSGSLDINGFDGTILTLVDSAYAAGVDGASVSFAGGLLGKYFTDAAIVNGVIVGNINMNSYNDAALSANGLAGLNLMSKALIALNPQAEASAEAITTFAASTSSTSSASNNPDLASVLDSLDSYKDAGAYAAADALGAAVAGVGSTALGAALQGDVQRQLSSIRNRSQMMGADPSVVNEYLPHSNMWMSAEAGSSKLTADGSQAGYSLNSTGGSIGMDFDFSDHFSMGVAFSALSGELSVESLDSANGDLNTMYGSVYARVHHKRWSHSFVATFGSVDASLERSISTKDGSIRPMGDTDGSALGLMYEVGYTYALNEDASTCMQPIFNISYSKASISGYSERNSDIALTIGDQELSTLSIAAGALVETVIGENLYNRASILSARAMLKFDAGDRASEADVTLTSNSGLTESIKGAEYGALGIELGLGLTIPVTEDVGAIFADVSCEFRSGRSSVNASVGYRFGF
ncbi:MAG: autotransporter domain-containing protein, partial [Akkermansia sp.]